MFKNKKTSFVFILLILIIALTGCNKKKQPIEADLSKIYKDNRELKPNSDDSDFILTTKSGLIALFDVNGNVLDELQIENSKKSDFIYCEDSGDIFSKNILDKNKFNVIFYALDKSSGKLYLIKNSNNKLKVFEEKSLKGSKNILEIKAYNGLFFYLVKDSNISANKYTIAKNKAEEMNGIIDYSADVPVERRGKTYSYIYLENLSKAFLKGMEIDKDLTDADISNMNLVDLKKDTFKIPFNINSWTVTNKEIVYYAEDIYGSYDMERNILSANYGLNSTIGSFYINGRYSQIYSINQMGKHSNKTILLKTNPDDLSIEKALEYEGVQPTCTYIDKINYLLFIGYKEDNLSTFGKMKVINLVTNKEVQTLSLKFVPTSIKGHNGYYYIMNEFEDYFIVGTVGSKDYSTYKKYLGKENTSDLLLSNNLKKDYFVYDANGRYIDEEGKLLDYRGNLINEYSQKVNRYGQLLDDYGRAINSIGELVDKYGNIIDENGIIIKYTMQTDGYYRSSNGTIVDDTGKAMIRQEDGSYIKDKEKIPDIEWHYDENGKIVINADYLEKYPDAKSWIKEDGSYIKGKSNLSNIDEDSKKK